jgi:hypothetical protein
MFIFLLLFFYFEYNFASNLKEVENKLAKEIENKKTSININHLYLQNIYYSSNIDSLKELKAAFENNIPLKLPEMTLLVPKIFLDVAKIGFCADAESKVIKEWSYVLWRGSQGEHRVPLAHQIQNAFGMISEQKAQVIFDIMKIMYLFTLLTSQLNIKRWFDRKQILSIDSETKGISICGVDIPIYSDIKRGITFNFRYPQQLNNYYKALYSRFIEKMPSIEETDELLDKIQKFFEQPQLSPINPLAKLVSRSPGFGKLEEEVKFNSMVRKLLIFKGSIQLSQVPSSPLPFTDEKIIKFLELPEEKLITIFEPIWKPETIACLAIQIPHFLEQRCFVHLIDCGAISFEYLATQLRKIDRSYVKEIIVHQNQLKQSDETAQLIIQLIKDEVITLSCLQLFGSAQSIMLTITEIDGDLENQIKTIFEKDAKKVRSRRRWLFIGMSFLSSALLYQFIIWLHTLSCLNLVWCAFLST